MLMFSLTQSFYFQIVVTKDSNKDNRKQHDDSRSWRTINKEASVDP